VFRGYEQSIEDTLKILDLKNLIDISAILSKTDRAVFFGIGGSGIVAQDAALRFSHLDIQAEAYNDPLFIIIQAKRMREGEVAVGVSHSGRTKVTCEALQLAGSRGAVTAGISNYMKSPLNTFARYFLCTSFPEERVKAAALSSRIAQLCIIDAIYLLAAKHKEVIWDTESLNRLIERLLRIG
jgi:DNA-binding MurR/RpiR family transcriptional regulator